MTTPMTRTRARDLLDVAAQASADEVERAFRRLAREHHPDHGGDGERFAQLVTARDVLLTAPPASARRADGSVWRNVAGSGSRGGSEPADRRGIVIVHHVSVGGLARSARRRWRRLRRKPPGRIVE